MSLSALLKAVRDQLIEELELPDGTCGIRRNGQPPAKAGDQFIGVYGSLWAPGPTNISQEQGIHETYSVSVALTRRTGTIPDHKMSEELWLKAVDGMEPVARKIIVAIHGKPYSGGLVERTDALIPGDDKIQVPLRWTGTDPEPEPVGPDWFGADGESARHYGMVLRIHFGQAERYQTFANLE